MSFSFQCGVPNGLRTAPGSRDRAARRDRPALPEVSSNRKERKERIAKNAEKGFFYQKDDRFSWRSLRSLR